MILRCGKMTNDVDESVTAHNGGNDHDQCHHHHDTHPALKWGTCSNIVTDCWEMSLIFPPYLISSYWMMSAILCKIFLITMSQIVMGWPAMPGESICDVTSLVTQGETQGGTSSPPRASQDLGPHTSSVRQSWGILLARSYLQINNCPSVLILS